MGYLYSYKVNQENSKSPGCNYLDLESTEDLLKLDDSRTFLSDHHDKLIILDEIQQAPDLFKVL